MKKDEIIESAIASLRTRITRVLPQEVRDCLDLLTEEQVWWRPNEQSNSVGNIVLHITGSLNHYLNFLVGKIEYQRDRDSEFAERRSIPRAELLAAFEEMLANLKIPSSTLYWASKRSHSNSYDCPTRNQCRIARIEFTCCLLEFKSNCRILRTPIS